MTLTVYIGGSKDVPTARGDHTDGRERARKCCRWLHWQQNHWAGTQPKREEKGRGGGLTLQMSQLKQICFRLQSSCLCIRNWQSDWCCICCCPWAFTHQLLPVPFSSNCIYVHPFLSDSINCYQTSVAPTPALAPGLAHKPPLAQNASPTQVAHFFLQSFEIILTQ